MFESRVLGVDPGVATVGLAVLERGSGGPRLVWAGTVRTPAGAEEASRLRAIHDAVVEAIARQRPGSVAVERVAWNRNQVSAPSVVLLAASEAGLPVDEYGPLEVKMAVTGMGVADKAQVRSALSRFHGLRGVPDQPDAA